MIAAGKFSTKDIDNSSHSACIGGADKGGGNDVAVGFHVICYGDGAANAKEVGDNAGACKEIGDAMTGEKGPAGGRENLGLEPFQELVLGPDIVQSRWLSFHFGGARLRLVREGRRRRPLTILEGAAGPD